MAEINSESDYTVESNDESYTDEEDVNESENETEEAKPQPKKKPEDLLIDNMDEILKKENLKDEIPQDGIIKEKKTEEKVEENPIIPEKEIVDLKEIAKKIKLPKLPAYKPPPEPKEKKITVKREKEITELLLLTQQLSMDESIYNVEYFNAMSDEELMQFRLDLFKTVDKKMEVLTKDSRFVTGMILRMASMGEKIMPKYLSGYSESLKGSEKDIERCIDEMIKRGDLESIMKSKLMDPKYQLMMILGGNLVTQISQNLRQAKTELKNDIRTIAQPMMQDVKKNFVSSPSPLLAPAPQQSAVFS